MRTTMIAAAMLLFTITCLAQERPYLGVQVDQQYKGKGVKISKVLPGTSAAKAGFKDGDVIIEAGGKAVTSFDDLVATLQGRKIGDVFAATVKRVSLELGGKGANIIYADADEKAVKRCVLHCMQNSGQSCNAPTRMLVERSIYDAAVKTATEVADAIDVGPASAEGRHIGPVVSNLQYNKIQRMIQTGIDEGARLVSGGLGRPAGLNRGYYVRPTVFADVSNDMAIAQQEIFGPVLAIIPFDTEEEALAMANDTVYGLTNYVQTTDHAKAIRTARALRSGMVEINGTSRGAGAPFGGYKQSGSGREGGVWGLDDFLEVKSVSGWVE